MTSWCLVVITGASRGLGKSIAISFAKRNKTPLHVILTGRTVEGLESTKAAIVSARNSDDLLVCDVIMADLADIRSLPEKANQIFGSHSDKSYGRAIFVNNAGSLGPLQSIGRQDGPITTFSETFDLNITSSCYLTSQFVKKYAFTTNPISSLVINISSLCAIQPFETWGLYCAGKAARDMYHKVLAEENKNNSFLRVINYAPGPLDTEMQREIREVETVQKDTQDYFKQMFENGQLISPDKSSEKLLDVLETDLFENGGHVDFYDELPQKKDSEV